MSDDREFNIYPTFCNYLFAAITPLMFAAALDNMAAYQLLISNNANPNSKNVNGQTALDVIMHNKQPKGHPNGNGNMHQSPVIPAPVITISQVPQQPAIINLASNLSERYRKSSGFSSSPSWFVSPNLSPLTPLSYSHQIFFPHDFSPSRLLSPINMCPHNNHFNTFISHSPHVPYNSPCMNYRIDDMNKFLAYNSDSPTHSPNIS